MTVQEIEIIEIIATSLDSFESIMEAA